MPDISLPASRCIALLATLIVSATASAQAPAPLAPPSDTVAQEAIALLQNGGAASRAAWIGRRLSARARQADSAASDQLMARLQRDGAPFQVANITVAGRHRWVRLVSPRSGRVVTVDLASDRAEPGTLGSVDVLETHAALADSIVWPATRPRDDAAAIATVRRNLDRLTQGNAFSGVVYVARHDSVLLSQGYGLANREDSMPNTPRTRFALASMGKMFTAAAIMQLFDAGRLRLDDTLRTVLPEYPNADRASRITIRQLLGHTAGLGDIWSTPKKPVPGLTGQLGAAAAVAYAPLQFEPGTRWSYSNEGYLVLGAIIEKLGGEPLIDYVTKHVFEPAGMHETVLRGGTDQFVPFRAVGYRPRVDDPLGAGAPRANWGFIGEGSAASGAGGGYSTAADIARFGRALREGKLMSDSLRAMSWTGKWDIPGYAGQKYGFASFVMPVGARTAVGHGGGGSGSGIDNGFKQFTDGSYTVVVLANMEPPSGSALADAIIRFLGAESPDATARR